MPDDPQAGQGAPQGTPPAQPPAAPPATPPAAPPAAPPAPPAGDATDWKAEARKWEQRAKDNTSAARELATIKAAQQTAEERAQAAATAAEQRAAAAVQRVASAEIRAALTGVVPDPGAVVEDLNLARFIGDDGEVKADAVTALRTKYAALAPAGPRAPAPNPAQGSGGTPKTVAEIIADAEKANTGTRQDTQGVMRMKSHMLLDQQK